jgi:hypothetical protein
MNLSVSGHPSFLPLRVPTRSQTCSTLKPALTVGIFDNALYTSCLATVPLLSYNLLSAFSDPDKMEWPLHPVDPEYKVRYTAKWNTLSEETFKDDPDCSYYVNGAGAKVVKVSKLADNEMDELARIIHEFMHCDGNE